MSAAKNMWMDAVDAVGQDYADERLTREEALEKMRRLGFNRTEAATMLDEAVS